MLKRNTTILLFFILFRIITSAQEKTMDTLACEYSVSENDKERIDKRRYVYATPHFFRIYNTEKNYASLQLGRRRSSGMFLYLKIFVFNTCIHSDYKLTLTFANKLKRKMKNSYDINCEGIFVRKLSAADVKALQRNQVASFTVQTYEKNYEFHVNDTIAKQLQKDIQCLTDYKFLK